MAIPRSQIPLNRALVDETGKVTVPWSFWFQSLNSLAPPPGGAYVIDGSFSTYGQTTLYQGLDITKGSSPANGDVWIAVDTGKIYTEQNGLWQLQTPAYTGDATVAQNTTTILLNSAQPNITSVGILTSLVVSGNTTLTDVSATNATFSFVSGNGSGLFDINGANIIGNVPTANFASFAGHANTANTVTDNAQPNITSVGTLTSLSVAGNANVGNLNATNRVTANANITSSNGFFVSSNANLGYWLNVSGNNVGKLYYNANAVKVEATDSTSNVQFAANGTVRLSIFANGLTSVNGPLSVSGNANIGNIGTAGILTVTGNANVGNIGATNGVFTNNVAITGNITTVDSVQFDTTANLAAVSVAQLTYNDGEGTLDLGLKGGKVTLNIGTQEYARVYNDELTTLVKGEVVYIAGAQGNRIAVKRARADVEATSFGTLGLVAENITSGSEGYVIVSGALYKLNTLGLTAGQTVYLSPTVAGGYTTTKPQAPDHLVVVGWVERVHATVGSIYVKVDNGYKLDELHDVRIISPTAGQALVYTSANLWENQLVNVVGTLANLSVTGNIDAGNINATNGVFSFVSGNGSLLSSITGANVTGTVANATYATTAGSALTANTVTDNAQPNITSVGTLTSLSVSGNVIVGNISATNGVFSFVSGDGFALSNITGANVTGTVANATYATSAGSALTANTVTDNAQPNITSVGTLTSLSVSGNATVGNINATLGNFTNVAGNGSLLTALNASNITTGTVNIARLPTLANTTDTTQGRLMRSGDWGFATTSFASGNLTNTRYNYSQIFRILSSETTGPGINAGVIALPFDSTPSTNYLAVGVNGDLYTGRKNGASATPTWVEILRASANANANLGNVIINGTLSATGNVTFNNQLNVGNNTANGNINNSTVINGGIHRTFTGQVSTANNAATTMFTVPSTAFSTWIVTAGVNTGNAANTSEVALLTTQTDNVVVATLANGGNINITAAATRLIQVTQTTGATANVVYTAIRIA
jgi:hypothetical protein